MTRRMTCLLTGLLLAGAATAQSPAATPGTDPVDRGRYLMRIAGCNDCHTAGYAMSGGNVPESQWLTGDHLGWQGPWGTTYATNLRLRFQDFTEAQWLTFARSAQLRPPMPWFALRDMQDADLKAIYAYLRHAGPAGAPAPAFVPPGQDVAGPVVLFPAPPAQ